MMLFFVMWISLVISVILEVVAFNSLDTHYDTDLASDIDSTMGKLDGCGDVHLELAIKFATAEPVIYERPEM